MTTPVPDERYLNSYTDAISLYLIILVEVVYYGSCNN